MQESRIFPIIYHVSARPYHRSGASFLHQFIQICGALQLLYSVNECAWIAPYIPKVSNFNMVVLNKIPALHHVLHVQEYNFAIW